MRHHTLQIGPFRYHIESNVPNVETAMERLYDRYPHPAEDSWFDFHIRLIPRAIGSSECRLFLDHEQPFAPFPRNQAGAVLEWGMNWSIWLNVAQWLVFHAAMLERNGNGLILAANSGDGKSTLTAGLAFHGWRLLSDELTLIDPEDTRTIEDGEPPLPQMIPIPRPICLKNESVSLIREFVPEAIFSDLYPETNKGCIAHVKPREEAVRRMHERVSPRWIVFPKYEKGALPQWSRWDKAEAMIQLGQNGVDYSTLGAKGFETLADVIHHCDCWKFVYSNLADAVSEFEKLTSGRLEE
ncbi:MAG: HprK-related kinase A [Planctomycetia bacterium]|nr:HprK-related kinase A [Planctomycetia bacterium]